MSAPAAVGPWPAQDVRRSRGPRRHRPRRRTPHDVVCLIGSSGSGKSTLLRCLDLLEEIDDGVIELEGREVSDPHVDPRDVRRSIGMVFQAYNLFPHLSVLANCTLVAAPGARCGAPGGGGPGAGAARALRTGRQGGGPPRPALRRSAAAGRAGAGPVHRAATAAARRDHRGARPRARGRGARRGPRARGRGGHDDGARHPRDGASPARWRPASASSTTAASSSRAPRPRCSPTPARNGRASSCAGCSTKHPDSSAVRITRMTYALGQGTGPLAGIKVVEIAGIGPGPHACMILADLGADVIRVERPGGQALTGGPTDLLNRGRPSVALDLKNPEAIATVLDLVAEADVLVEGMRPGHHRTARARSRRVPRAQPAPGLRPDDRLGADRPAGQGGRPRHELHRDHRRPVRHGPGQVAAALPGQPGRRLRWRVDVPRHRRARRPARGTHLAARARSSTRRSSTAPRT